MSASSSSGSPAAKPPTAATSCPSTTPSYPVPTVSSDPRFIAARHILSNLSTHLPGAPPPADRCEDAVSLFSVLLQECMTKHCGSDDAAESPLSARIHVAQSQYEYGHAILRRVDLAREADDGSGGGPESADADQALAVEQMKQAASIYESYLDSSDAPSAKFHPYAEHARCQLPRCLVGIGDAHLHSGRHGDATAAYLRAVPLREKAAKDEGLGAAEKLKNMRLSAEAHALVADALLAVPPGADVTVSGGEDGDREDGGGRKLLVAAAERVDYARGYYEQARKNLQDAVFFMGEVLSESSVNLGSEKSDICHLATIMMAVGNTLAEIDEEGQGAGTMASSSSARIKHGGNTSGGERSKKKHKGK